MSLQFFSQLSDNLGRLLEYADDFNVIVKVGNHPEFAVFQAHSVILRARSEYFRAALSSNWAKKEGECFVFEKPNISPAVFDVILSAHPS
ncbi:3008_t:CDS:2 [Ambispora gerdemannii]|uniref:3008_t:CDS:1 n=1 Tax=Ambispora gerdemannii TaxID=144530 RepID=A0A9N8WGV2_9GLOM|nr:3008_t:CDS:2 [Ambispora gerdemannii]